MTIPLNVSTTPPSPEDVKSSYGFVAMIANSVPEVGNLMNQAVRENWTPNRFSMALANTGWWKSTPDGARQWLVKNIADPSSAEQDLKNGAAKIKADLVQLGIPEWIGVTGKATNEDRYRDLYMKSMLGGMDDTARRQMIWQEVNSSRDDRKNDPTGWKSNLGGVYGKAVTDMYTTALQYGYAPPDLQNRVLSEADRIMRAGGVGDTEGWKRQMINYASSKYGAFGDRIKGGETVMDVAKPYLDTYAQTLELDPSAIKLSDNLVQKALQGTPNGKGGVEAPPVWQFQQELRQDPRWGNTTNAKQAAAQTLTTIGRAFGMVG